MSKKATIHKLGPNDTLFVDQEELKVRMNVRPDGENGPRLTYELNAEFGAQWEAFTVRKAIIAKGEVDLANWDLIAESEGRATGGFDPNAVKF